MIPQDVKQNIFEFINDNQEYTVSEIFEYIKSFRGFPIVSKLQIRSWLEYESSGLNFGIVEKRIVCGHVFYRVR